LITGAGVNDGASIGTARRSLANERSQDPGTFSLASGETGVTATLAIRPVDALNVGGVVMNRRRRRV
jgi:hypothetical protein